VIADRTDTLISMGGFTEMGAVTRHRTTGTRDRILSRLRAAGEITDPGGLASAALAKAVDYRGSSAAFAQLLSGMERDGLIEREIRGKRTYRIGLAGPGLEMASARGEQEFEPRTSAAAAFDYDELAMRLLAQVVWRIAAPPDEVFLPDEALPVARALPGSGPEHRGEDLTLSLASLERRLASIQSRQRELSAENARLSEQLAAAQRSLTEIQAGSVGGRLGPTERQVLQRLLSLLHDTPARRQSAEAG
jgi:hypothetical protein